jgi:cullin 4
VFPFSRPLSLRVGLCSVQVLTAGSWPDYKPVDCKLPAEVEWFQSAFKSYYDGRQPNRRLTWQNTLATCILRAHFPKGRKELAVSGFQAAVLTAFNEADRLSFADVKQRTGLNDVDLRRTLQSLALPKDPDTRVLIKEPKVCM